MNFVIFGVCVLVMLVAVAGTILPLVPGLPLIFVSYLGYGLYDKWQSYGLWTMVIVGAVVALSLGLDQLTSIIGVQKLGGGKAGMIGSVVCAIIGLVFFSLPGLIIGAFAGAVIFEMVFSKKELGLALKAGTGALIGFLVGSFFKFVLALILTLYFIWLFI
ncbi:MAG: DUF456 domain-containing protein [Deltaproteobacteria bacterium]|jgi:uncharacterized protein YqgC (DUF456 family)|nr:DUF456 domain-containing protein [Deltaproteobacteria bacterium]